MNRFTSISKKHPSKFPKTFFFFLIQTIVQLKSLKEWIIPFKSIFFCFKILVHPDGQKKFTWGQTYFSTKEPLPVTLLVYCLPHFFSWPQTDISWLNTNWSPFFYFFHLNHGPFEFIKRMNHSTRTNVFFHKGTIARHFTSLFPPTLFSW